jgi:hypothetical protein
VKAARKDGHRAGGGTFVEANVPAKAGCVATHLAFVFDENISAEHGGVTLNFAADPNVAAKARHFREFLARAYKDVVAELGAIMRAVGKAGRGKSGKQQPAEGNTNSQRMQKTHKTLQYRKNTAGIMTQPESLVRESQAHSSRSYSVGMLTLRRDIDHAVSCPIGIQ